MSVRQRTIWAAAVSCLVLSGCVFVGSPFEATMKEVTVESSPRWMERNKVLLLDVDGFLSEGDGWALLSGTSLADVKEKLKRAADDSHVVAVVLRINSPGGEASASDLIHREITEFKRATGKPVVASLQGVAASGGYFAACAADRIVAAPSTVTGSVGVVMHYYNVEGLFQKLGLRSEVFKSGAMKDIGSMHREPSEEERRVLHEINRALFERFATAVRAGRSAMTDEDFARISDGRPVTASEALALHMVDEVGYLDQALARARAAAGVSHADVILYRSRRSSHANIYAGSDPATQTIEHLLRRALTPRGPAFLYLWSPAL